MARMLRNDDFENHVRTIQGISGTYQGHVRRLLEVPRCSWKVSKIFQDFVRIMIFMSYRVHQIMILTSIHMPLEESASHPLSLNKRECPMYAPDAQSPVLTHTDDRQ